MTGQVNRVLLFALAVILVASTSVSADIFCSDPSCPPDPSLWTIDPGGITTNPSGEVPVPAVIYDPATGILSVKTDGVNQTVDTLDGTLIGGDDVGMISIIVEGPEPTSISLLGPRGTAGPPNFIGTLWTGEYFVPTLALQLVGTAANDAYLMPIGETQVAVYPTGLTKADFGPVEMGLSFELGAPGGGITRGAVQFVPEPAALCLSLTALLTLCGFVRRRR